MHFYKKSTKKEVKKEILKIILQKAENNNERRRVYQGCQKLGLKQIAKNTLEKILDNTDDL